MKEKNKYESPQMDLTMIQTVSMIAASVRTEKFVSGEEFEFE